MHIPQLLALAILATDLILAAVYHGKVRTTRYTIYTSLASATLWIVLLWWGGYFSK